MDAESTATLVRAFVTSRIDYCNSVHVGAPKALIDKLQRVLIATANVTSETDKYDLGFSQLLHEKLQWLDVRDSVTFKLVVMVRRCLNPGHLSTSPSTVSHCPARDISVPLSEIYCTYHIIDSTCTAARFLLLLVCPPGTVSGPCPQSELH